MDKIMLFRTYSDNDDVNAVKNVVDRNTWWNKGEEVENFEHELSNLCNTKFATTFHSGTSALYSILEILNLNQAHVIVPSFTYIATVNAIKRSGNIPIYTDIETDTLSLDINDVKRKMTSKTKAVVLVHFAGNVAKDVYKIKQFCKNNDLYFIEDAAQSLGAKKNTTMVGSFGNMSAFSFAFNKIISTGNGGAVVTNSEEYNEKLKAIRFQGFNNEKQFMFPGYNFSLSSMNAALGLSQINKINYLIDERRRLANLYNSYLKNDYITIPIEMEDTKNVYQTYNILLQNQNIRDSIIKNLNSKNIPTQIKYTPTNEFYNDEAFVPNTYDIYKRILSLPFHLYLSEEKIEYISNTILDAL